MYLKKQYYSSYQNIIFALLLISGAVKFVFSDIEFPIDITLVFSSLLLVDILFNLSLNSVFYKKISSNQAFFLGAYISLYVVMVFSLVYTKSNSYGYSKTFFFILNLICFVYPIFMKRFNHRVFFKTILVPLVLVSIWFLIKRYLSWYSPDPNVRIFYKQFSGSYLLLSNALAFCILYYIFLRKYLLALALFLLIVALGGRGPIIFLILLVLYWKLPSILKLKLSRNFIKKAQYVILIIIPLAYFFRNQLASAFKVGFGRIMSFIDYGQDKSVLSRFDYFGFTLENMFDSVQTIFLGHGIGSFGIMYNGLDKKEFPHNIFLEAWFELGLIGLTLTVLLFFVSLFVYRNKPLVIKLMCVYFLLHALKSGSFDGMRFMSAIYGMLIFFSYDVFDRKMG